MSVANGKSFRNEPQKTDVDTDYEEVITVIKKRVGGGYKYIEVKREKPTKRRTKRLLRNNESKTSGDEMEKEDGPEKFTDESSLESLSLAMCALSKLPHAKCEDRIRFDEYPILKYIQENVIGHNLTILGPFGVKKVIYCDYTASGRSLAFIEDYIRNFVQPFYANTHSETGRNSRQTSKFREEARSIIKRCVNADKDDVVIFTGSGATAAIHKLCWGLKINMPRVAEETVVFSGPYEHHSNMLLWKEFGATVVRIRDTQDGVIDIEHLEKELKFWKEKKRQMLVCVSAASNVTGIITDTDEVAIVAHRYGAFAAFDYAGGGPYLKIDMNPSKQGYKDAVFISPHKFVGGPGTPGIVVAKKWMFRNTVPERVGGGTVTYVSRDFHMYTHDIEGREEGGTPAIIESIRTGLVFQLKEAVGEDVILKRDQDLCCRAFGVWERNPNLKILGNHRVERITIFSFIVIHEGTNKFIHYNFVSTLLNDLFGIQSRGGCVCAGPYGHDLLGITETMAKRLKWFTHTQPGKDASHVHTPMNIMKPGFCRINLSYFDDDALIDYVINAVDMVAKNGWKLLPQYTFDPHSGIFLYKGDATLSEEELFSLADIDYSGRRFHVNRRPPDMSRTISYDDMTKFAENIFRDNADMKKTRVSTASQKLNELLPVDKKKLRWFLTPQEANDYLTGAKAIRRYKQIMTPRIESKLTNTSESDNELSRSLEFQLIKTLDTNTESNAGKSNHRLSETILTDNNHKRRRSTSLPRIKGNRPHPSVI